MEVLPPENDTVQTSRSLKDYRGEMLSGLGEETEQRGLLSESFLATGLLLCLN